MKNPRSLFWFFFLILAACSKPGDEDKGTPRELVIIDEVFTHQSSGGDDKKMGFSEFHLPEDAPSNWVSPVNYKDGTVYYRVSVLTKPDTRLIYYQMGFQWEGGCSGHPFKEKFPDNSMMPITEPGIYQASQTIESMWEPDCQLSDPIDWTRRMTRMLVVIWDENFHQADDRWGYGSNVEDLYGYYPMQVHFQSIVVPKNGTFSGWENYPISLP